MPGVEDVKECGRELLAGERDGNMEGKERLGMVSVPCVQVDQCIINGGNSLDVFVKPDRGASAKRRNLAPL